MLVRLKRNLFLGGHLYEASRFGVEIPAELDGQKVVLPKDAEILSEPPSPKKAKDPKMALSQMGQAKPKGFVDAMKDQEDED